MLGGVLVWYRGWPAVFWLNIPMGILGVILALTLYEGPADRAHPHQPRLARRWTRERRLFCVTLAIIQGNDWGWVSAAIIGLFAGGTVLLLAWAWWELRAPSPLDLRLFRDRTFAAAATAVMTVDTAMMGTMFMGVIFMIAMMDYSELKAGLAIASLPVAVMVLTPPAGWLADRIGPRWLAMAGALVTAAGLIALGHLARTAPVSGVVCGAPSSEPASAFRCRRCSPPGWAPSPAAARASGRGCSTRPGSSASCSASPSSWRCSHTPWGRP